MRGKPIIASQWSGHLDFLPEDLAILLPGTLGNVPPSACNDWLIKEAQWFNVNYSVAAQKIEEVFESYLKFIPNAEKLRQQNSEKFTYEAGNKAFIDILEKHLPVFEKKVQIVLPKFKKVTPVTPSATPVPTPTISVETITDTTTIDAQPPTPQSQAPNTLAPEAPNKE